MLVCAKLGRARVLTSMGRNVRLLIRPLVFHKKIVGTVYVIHIYKPLRSLEMQSLALIFCGKR